MVVISLDGVDPSARRARVPLIRGVRHDGADAEWATPGAHSAVWARYARVTPYSPVITTDVVARGTYANSLSSRVSGRDLGRSRLPLARIARIATRPLGFRKFANCSYRGSGRSAPRSRSANTEAERAADLTSLVKRALTEIELMRQLSEIPKCRIQVTQA